PSSATHKFRPPVPSSAPTSSAHLCPAEHPPVPSSAPTSVPPTSAIHLCPPPVPRSDASQYRLSVPIISVTYQCRLSVTPH
ncbi:unnamed protein product, partial [Staurois parvus]